MLPVGSTTLSREGVDRGLEPDEGFYLGNLERIRDPDEIDLDIDPPPDLAVEITKSALDRLGIYGALGVPEFWRFDGRSLRVLLRQQDGSYREAASSAAFPGVPMDEIARLAAAAEGIRDENEWCDRFRMWVRGVVLPRLQAGDGD